MKHLFFLIIPLLSLQIGNAQTSSKFNYFVGYGFYEGYNIGTEYCKSDTQSVSLSIGYDKIKYNNQESFSLTLGYDYAIFKNRKNNLDKFKWHMSNRLVLWQLDDDFYTWRAISAIPSLSRKFNIHKKASMSFDIGPSFNLILNFKRKTFKEVGWPHHVYPNFRILFII